MDHLVDRPKAEGLAKLLRQAFSLLSNLRQLSFVRNREDFLNRRAALGSLKVQEQGIDRAAPLNLEAIGYETEVAYLSSPHAVHDGAMSHLDLNVGIKSEA